MVHQQINHQRKVNKQGKRNQYQKLQMLCFVPEHEHTEHGANASAKKRKKDQSTFLYAPGTCTGSFFIGQKKAEGDNAHDEHYY